MKARELITIIDSMKPNAFGEAAKLQWVNEAEGYIWTEVMLNSPVTYVEIGLDGELMVKPPHSELYWPYLMAMIDLANGDYERYTNSMQLYNDRIRRYMRWYADNYRPADNGETTEPKYDADPYAIALERGYEGTEERWRAETAGVKTTAADVIAFVDSIKPNVFSDAAKLQWINEVESHIWTEIMLNAPLEYTAITEETINGDLLAPAPHSEVYWPYLCALIDFANGDYDRYANTLELYNLRMRRYMRWYTDKYRPADGVSAAAQPYISAYGIAVAHGFSGSEEEWIASLKGDKGDKGDAFTIADVYPSVEALRAAFPDGTTGIYAVENTGYIYSHTAEDWVPYGLLQGERGEKGEKGDTGARGIQGATGDPAYIAGEFNSLATLQAFYPNGNNNAYIVDFEYDYGNSFQTVRELCVWSVEQKLWVSLGPIQGPEGPAGDSGWTFTPEVNEEGWLGWSMKKHSGTRPNPVPSVNIVDMVIDALDAREPDAPEIDDPNFDTQFKETRYIVEYSVSHTDFGDLVATTDSFADIKEKFENGTELYAYDGTTTLPLVQIDDTQAVFGSIDKDTQLYTTFTLSGDGGSVHTTELGGKQFVVNITSTTSGGTTTYAADKTYAEIKAAYDAGVVCMATYPAYGGGVEWYQLRTVLSYSAFFIQPTVSGVIYQLSITAGNEVTRTSVALLKTTGGTLTGALKLHGDPTAALHAATKQYVDAATANTIKAETYGTDGQIALSNGAGGVRWEDIPNLSYVLTEQDKLEIAQIVISLIGGTAGGDTAKLGTAKLGKMKLGKG